MKQNDAYTLGFIARMNGGDRQALGDEKLMTGLPADLPSKTPLLMAWFDGYDACSREYARVLLNNRIDMRI